MGFTDAVKKWATPPRKRAHDEALASGKSEEEATEAGQHAADVARGRSRGTAAGMGIGLGAGGGS